MVFCEFRQHIWFSDNTLRVFGQCLLKWFMSSSFSCVGSTAQECNHWWYVYFCGLCIIAIHWLTLLHTNDHDLFFGHWVIPSRGGFTFRACVGDLSHGTNTFWEAGLNVLPFKPVVGNITCWFTTTWFDLYFDLSIMTDMSGIYLFSGKYSAGWSQQCCFQSWVEIFLYVLKITTAHLGFSFNWVFIGFCFPLGPVFWLGMAMHHSSSL